MGGNLLWDKIGHFWFFNLCPGLLPVLHRSGSILGAVEGRIPLSTGPKPASSRWFVAANQNAFLKALKFAFGEVQPSFPSFSGREQPGFLFTITQYAEASWSVPQHLSPRAQQGKKKPTGRRTAEPRRRSVLPARWRLRLKPRCRLPRLFWECLGPGG